MRDRRGDVLIEAAPGNVDELLNSALPFFEAGYPVELVVLAVRATDSRLATALRYARALQAGIPGRFTTAAGHDRCFQRCRRRRGGRGGAPGLCGGDGDPPRRPGTAAPRSLRPRAAARHGRSLWERSRLYTEQEAARFLRLHQGLRRALPEHRAELDGIAALARPLLPVRWQPSGSGYPARWCGCSRLCGRPTAAWPAHLWRLPR
ncbi:zeta toxin family protein [Streptomyces puniciscabiei]|uniref:zeta toxin family protein n=1 Tax=Streptomyces puniciscabiei TaxID=164348 RepID=UPI00332BAACC